MLLNRDAILGAQDLKTQDVEVPEWGGTARVRMLSGAERDAYGRMLIGADGKPSMDGYRAKLLSLCIVGEDGAQLFTPDDVAALEAKCASALERVYTAAEALNGLGAKALETAAGN